MLGFLTSVWDFLQGVVGVDSIGDFFAFGLLFLVSIVSFLPDSPFTGVYDAMPEGVQDGLGIVNSFVPFGAITDLLVLWAGAIIAAKVYFIIKDYVFKIVRR